MSLRSRRRTSDDTTSEPTIQTINTGASIAVPWGNAHVRVSITTPLQAPPCIKGPEEGCTCAARFWGDFENALDSQIQKDLLSVKPKLKSIFDENVATEMPEEFQTELNVTTLQLYGSEITITAYGVTRRQVDEAKQKEISTQIGARATYTLVGWLTQTLGILAVLPYEKLPDLSDLIGDALSMMGFDLDAPDDLLFPSESFGGSPYASSAPPR